MNPIESRIVDELTRTFTPVHLQVVNESHMHSVPANSETHFKVTLVSQVFAEQRQVQRHQAVYRALAAELAGPVHALALHTFSPDEWDQTGGVPASPNCLGGGKQG